MAVNLSPIGNDAPFVDSSGNPASGYSLYTYTAGSTTPQNTYTTSAGSVANANPIVLNSSGYPASGGNVVQIYLTAGVSYKFVLKDGSGNTIWTRDNISGINDTTVTIDQWVSGPAPTYISATSFSLVGDQTSTFHVGRRVKTTNSGGTVYGTITASAYAALTTITVVNDSGTLDSGLSGVSYGLLSQTNPAVPNLYLKKSDGAATIINGSIVATVAANALTVAIKTATGDNPTPGNPVYALFRKSTLTDSGFDIVPITSALSVVVSSGSTLGHASAIAQHIFVYLINNAGTAELAVSNLPPDYPSTGTFLEGNSRLISTTAEGGAGAADSATGVYSTTARSNVPWVCVAKMLSTQTTAGTWAANMTQVDQAPFSIPLSTFRATGTSSQLFADNTFTKQTMSTEHFDIHDVYDAGTNYRHQPNVAGVYRYRTGVAASVSGSHYLIASLFKNGSEHTRQQITTSAGFQIVQHTDLVYMNGTTDYIESYAYQNSGGNLNLDNSYSPFFAERVPGGK